MLAKLIEQEKHLKHLKEADNKIMHDNDAKLSHKLDVDDILRNGYVSDEIDKVDSIFKVIHYMHRCHSKRKLRYPSFRVSGSNEIYFKTMEEVEEYMQKRSHKTHPAGDDNIDLYAYVVIEIPLREEVNVDVLDHNLSFRTYLPDGTLWGKNDYGYFMSKRAIGDEYNYWGRRNQFWGRMSEEIRFKPGDIVEILGCPGNDYWENETVNLAIVVKTPPTIAEVEEMREQYFATHSGSDLCDHALSIEFGHSLDTYEVISFEYDGIDHAPTICVFEPTKQVSSRRKEALMEMYKKYEK